jgi:hypothetical protein
MLEKLNQVLTRLDDSADLLAAIAAHTSLDNEQSPATRADGVVITQAAPVIPLTQDLGALQFEYLSVPSGTAAADTVLSWPIFDNHFTHACLTQELFIAMYANAISEESADVSLLSRTSRSTATPDQEAVELVERFLQFVHTKNPILDAGVLRANARRLSEMGPEWEASSCLVVGLSFLAAFIIDLYIQMPFISSTNDH